jgi:TetR/AcrR family transcriptional repressor of nem operon
MPQDRATATRAKLVQTATELIRRKGYIATRIDDVCEHAGVTKGAFFHHFATKEDLAEACLVDWGRSTGQMLLNAPFQNEPDPSKRVLGVFDFFIELFDQPDAMRSCLVGTTVQEVSETHPQLRLAANQCFEAARSLFKSMLEEACQSSSEPVDTTSLADLWMATLQGSLILYKASQNPAVIRTSLQHTKNYIAGILPANKGA